MEIYETQKSGYLISTDPGMLDIPLIHAFLSNHSYWAQGIAFPVVEKAVRHSLCFGLYRLGPEEPAAGERPEQAGFARVITDYSTQARLVDVFILPEHRGRGLGKWLVETVLNHPELRDLPRWTLSTRDAHDLYARFGFRNLARPEMQMERVWR
jgi:GNAT superfamily N-acetyltransferase